jgi:transposase
MAELKMKCVFNASYSPEYNPIELVFSMAKRSIKQTRLRLLAKGQTQDIKKTID